MIPASRAASRITLLGCAIGLAALAIALPGCGDDSKAKAGGTPISSAEKPATGAKQDASQAKPSAAQKRCAGQVGGFLDTLDTLRERLVSGLSYEEYVGEIDVVRASYEEVPVGELTLACLAAAGTPGENAFGKYIAAANSWGECIEEEECDAPTIEPVLQKHWRGASHLLDEAQAGLGV